MSAGSAGPQFLLERGLERPAGAGHALPAHPARARVEAPVAPGGRPAPGAGGVRGPAATARGLHGALGGRRAGTLGRARCRAGTRLGGFDEAQLRGHMRSITGGCDSYSASVHLTGEQPPSHSPAGAGFVYLDHAATTPMRPEAVAAMAPFLAGHVRQPERGPRRRPAAKTALEDAREEVAALLGAQPGEVVFTAGGTEADNLAVKGAARRARPPGAVDAVVTTAFEHKGVLAVVRPARPSRASGSAGCRCRRRVSSTSTSLAAAVDDRTALVSVMLVNNEVGTDPAARRRSRRCVRDARAARAAAHRRRAGGAVARRRRGAAAASTWSRSRRTSSAVRRAPARSSSAAASRSSR